MSSEIMFIDIIIMYIIKQLERMYLNWVSILEHVFPIISLLLTARRLVRNRGRKSHQMRGLPGIPAIN